MQNTQNINHFKSLLTNQISLDFTGIMKVLRLSCVLGASASSDGSSQDCESFASAQQQYGLYSYSQVEGERQKGCIIEGGGEGGGHYMCVWSISEAADLSVLPYHQ